MWRVLEKELPSTAEFPIVTKFKIIIEVSYFHLYRESIFEASKKINIDRRLIGKI